jgi:hypothetical protein
VESHHWKSFGRKSVHVRPIFQRADTGFEQDLVHFKELRLPAIAMFVCTISGGWDPAHEAKMLK